MVIYAPRETEPQITRVLFQLRSGAGQRIMGRSAVTPVDGIVANRDDGKIAHENQMRIEILVRPDEFSPVVKALAEFQTDDRIWYDVYPLNALEQETGIGRVGSLDSAVDLKTLAQMIKTKLKLGHVKYAGDPALSVKTVAVCSGSGASLLADFFTSGAQVFVSGDLRYHDARDAEFAGLVLIDIGHFHSEHFIVEALAKRLAGIFADSEMNLTVNACDLEKDPFTVL